MTAPPDDARRDAHVTRLFDASIAMMEVLSIHLNDRRGPRAYAHAAGFSSVETLPIGSDRFWSSRLHA